ncbi:hypothetical protein H072_1805 [Dactylellina haptotyla CBS 200.50]|uniref:FAS1 domain-containing protein n=1 Tax=Dactylellina haptotyla (strain CBS 200.50) TaxID=1284197 RepID=S8AT71_DACHA|nr:hypothetical protein H072_1805 [Dactylellina haptotyla CBS 200.50]
MKVSILLLPAAAVLGAALLVVPDEPLPHLNVKKVGFTDRQAPITSEDKTEKHIVDSEKPHHDGEPCHKKHRGGLRPEFVLRRHHRDNHNDNFFDGPHVDLASLEGFHATALDAPELGHFGLDPLDAFYDFYRTPGEHHHHHRHPHHPPPPPHPYEEDPHFEHGEDWPPKPPSWPPKVPGHPGDIPERPPQWPPRKPGEPGEPGHDLPEWPPRPTGAPPHGPPHEPPEGPPDGPRPPPHHGPPKWPPKRPGHPGKPGHPGPPKRPHHPPRRWHHRHNETIWELISKSNYTTKFAKAISEFEDIVSILNGTVANYTLFVPTDKAFEKFKKAPKDWKPSKEFIKKVLTYHLTSEPYPIFKLLLSHTIPSVLDAPNLGGPQRLRVGLGPGGLRVNFYSRVVAGNIFASNGIIHGVDSILFPPPKMSQIISFFPSQFSTLRLAAHLTNLTSEVPKTFTGATLFAPPNGAFQKLGPRINAFLFSPWGRKYLKALLKYHIVLNETLYSDAYYHPTAETKDSKPGHFPRIPKGHYHVDLPTLLTGKHLSIDISRFGGLINIIINGLSSVKVEDGIAKDGVIQVVSNILIPPKQPPTEGFQTAEAKAEFEEKAEMEDMYGMTVEEFVERFKGLVDEDDVVEGEYKEEDVITMWDS